jgi:large subunit ribosomal protein L21
MNMYVCEIAGRQYMVTPGQILTVNHLKDVTDKLIVDKVLLETDGDKIEVGAPYLSKKLEFEVIGDTRGEKIRVSKYHAKSNYRKVTGSRSHLTQIRLVDGKKTEKKENKWLLGT